MVCRRLIFLGLLFLQTDLRGVALADTNENLTDSQYEEEDDYNLQTSHEQEQRCGTAKYRRLPKHENEKTYRLERRRKIRHEHESNLGAENTPNIPGASNAPLAPGAENTPNIPGAGSIW